MTLKQQLTQISEAGLARMPDSVAQVLLDSVSELAATDMKANSLQVGDRISNFELPDIDGHSRSVQDLITGEYLILNFYRGGWCPYCNLELRTYQSLAPDFAEAGATIVGVSAETPEFGYQTSAKNKLTFPLLTDENAAVMKTFGIVFTLSDALRKEYANFGIDLSRLHGNQHFELPVPAVYVINRDLEVVFAHFDENYMTRLEPADLLAKLKAPSIFTAHS